MRLRFDPTDALADDELLVRGRLLTAIDGGGGGAATDGNAGGDDGAGGDATDDGADDAGDDAGADDAGDDQDDDFQDEGDDDQGDEQDDQQRDGEARTEGQARQPGRANLRIRELRRREREATARAEAAERNHQALMERFGGDRGQQKPWLEQFQPDGRYEKVHGTLGPYLGGFIQHAVQPIAQALIRARQENAALIDRFEFYSDNPRFAGDKKLRGIIERAHDYLQQRSREPVSREDALYYLQGHPRYKKLFVTEGQQREALDRDLTGARRRAGRMGGRPAAKVRGGEKPDLASMSDEERVKYIERHHGAATL